MSISVFITSYNQKNFLREAIDSVLEQTLPASQIIVVDDCSRDGSRQLIESYARRFPNLFSTILHDRNHGVAQTRIDALEAVRCKYVTYLDGDDWFLPEKLEREYETLLCADHADIVYSDVEYMSESGADSLYRWTGDSLPPDGSVFLATFSRNFPRRDLFRMELVCYEKWKQVGFHDPALEVFEDFDMRIRLTKKLRVVFVPEVLSRVRSHGHGISKMEAHRRFKALDYIFRKSLPLLDDVPPDDAALAKRDLARWIYIRGRRAIAQSLLRGNLHLACSLFRPTAYYWNLSHGRADKAT